MILIRLVGAALVRSEISPVNDTVVSTQLKALLKDEIYDDTI